MAGVRRLGRGPALYRVGDGRRGGVGERARVGHRTDDNTNDALTLTGTGTHAPASSPTDEVTPQAQPNPPLDPDAVPPGPDPVPPGPDAGAAVRDRIDTADPVDFAVDVADRRFAPASTRQQAATARSTDTVVLARNDTFADALAGAVLTADAPLLLTGRDALPPVTADALDRLLGGSGGTVVVLGGPAAIAEAVTDTLAADGRTVVRLAGATRVHTALAIADHARGADTTGGRVALARGYAEGDSDATRGWADAVTAGGWAAATGTPILLTRTEALHPDLAAWLEFHEVDGTTVLGGPAAVSDAAAAAAPNATRVAGRDRHATAAAISTSLWRQPATGLRSHLVFNATSVDGWAYGLVAAGLAADTGAPILTVGATHVPAPSASLIRSCGQPQVAVTLLGDTERISTTVAETLDTLDGEAC